MPLQYVRLLTVLIITCLAAGSAAQPPDVVVGEIGFPAHQWGKQNLPFDITNNSDWLKFLVVEMDVAFEGSYVNPHRVTRTTYILEPEDKLAVNPELEIPGNYGQMTLWVRVFDVVDTLDDLSLGERVFEQPFKIRFNSPDAVKPYFQEKISLPPLVGNHGLLDNEFARLMLILTHKGKSLAEIAEICQAEISYVTGIAEQLEGAGYLQVAEEVYSPAIPVITQDFAVAGRELADRASDRLTERIAANLAGRRGLIDSLGQAGVYTGDSTNFFEGGTLLYQPYPLVAGLYMWRILGEKFIVGNRGLYVFGRTDPCWARIGRYMYVVVGGDFYNGNHYYNAAGSKSGIVAHFGDRVPTVICEPGFEKKFSLRQNVDWRYATDAGPESFLYDTTLVNPMLNILDQGIEDMLRSIIMELRELNSEQGYERLAVGTKYWFWNLTATRTVAKLVESGALKPSGNGQFRFMEKGE